MPNPGAYTSDMVPASLLYTEFMDMVGTHNERTKDFLRLFCGEPTKNTVVEARHRGVDFEPAGGDTGRPRKQHVPRLNIVLEEPVRWALGQAVTRLSWEKGISADTVRVEERAALDADYRLVTETVLQAALTDGHWCHGSFQPPDWKMNRFLVTHNHYLAYAANGIPAKAHYSRARTHLFEHGYDRDFVAWINRVQAEAVENLVPWDTQVTATPLIERLQQLGFTPQFEASGIPVIVDDWVPDNYTLVMSLQEPPMRWKIWDNATTADLINYGGITPGDMDMGHFWLQELVRWTGGPTVVAPAAGVAIYLDGAAWVDSTGWRAWWAA